MKDWIYCCIEIERRFHSILDNKNNVLSSLEGEDDDIDDNDDNDDTIDDGHGTDVFLFELELPKQPMPSLSPLNTTTNTADADATNTEDANTDVDVTDTEKANTHEANTQEASFTNTAPILMSNKTATKTGSNSSVTPVSNHPHLLN